MTIRFPQAVLPGAGAAKWIPAKTAWGDPDLQGVWTSDDLHDVPLERPAKFGTRRFLTEDELVERMKSLNQYATAAETGDRPKVGFWASQKGVDAEAVPAQWVEYAKHASRLTSLVEEPSNGRVPARAPDAQKLRAAQPNYFNLRPASWEDLGMYDRCITRGVTGSFFPTIYGNGSEFVQQPGLVAIRCEMIRETRMVPTDNEATIRDPKTFTPRKVAFPITHEDGYQISEYACHEGNKAMRKPLSGARAEEKAYAEKAPAAK